jgi:magnesium chelatase family protein
LAEAVGSLSGQAEVDPHSVDLEEVLRQLAHMEEHFVVEGQDYAKRAFLIAAAGGHRGTGDPQGGDGGPGVVGERA